MVFILKETDVWMCVCAYMCVVFMYVPLSNTYYWPDIVLYELYVCVYFKALINDWDTEIQ